MTTSFERYLHPDTPLPEDRLEGHVRSRHAAFCDISDLVFYIGHHEHLTGIQRVQASIIEEFLIQKDSDVRFIAFDTTASKFCLLDNDTLSLILADLKLPHQNRSFEYDREMARIGILPGSSQLSPSSFPANSCILLLGAAWVIEDYFRHINLLRSETNARFACLIHDLIPVYARETCDQGTAMVFRSFMATSRLSTDLYICVSKNTERDLLRYFRENAWTPPRTHVVTHATTLAKKPMPKTPDWFSDDPAGFVLVVSTIEGRKNHDLLFRIWDRLTKEHPDVTPKLICIGRPGWRAENFLLRFVATKGLGGKIEIQSDVADQELEFLYSECLFTVYPSLYEGWGLPISESLCYGKLCVCSNTSSMPEAGGDLVSYIDPHDLDGAFEKIRDLVTDRSLIAKAEAKIRKGFTTRPWSDVATEYLVAVDDIRDDRSHMPTIPGHFAFRSLNFQAEGLLGDRLLDGVIDFLRSDLATEPLSPADFENGHLARGPGDWHLLESWGCWIGLDGASMNFMADERREYCAYVSYQVLAPFINGRVRIVANGVTTFHMANTNVLNFNFTAKKGKNVLNISMDVKPEQRDESMRIDARGLMIGLKEMACIEKTDMTRRLDLLQAVSKT